MTLCVGVCCPRPMQGAIDESEGFRSLQISMKKSPGPLRYAQNAELSGFRVWTRISECGNAFQSVDSMFYWAPGSATTTLPLIKLRGRPQIRCAHPLPRVKTEFAHTKPNTCRFDKSHILTFSIAIGNVERTLVGCASRCFVCQIDPRRETHLKVTEG